MKNVVCLKIACVLAAGSWPIPASAAPTDFDVPKFCAAVEFKVLALNLGHPNVLFAYDQMLVEAAGVKEADSTEVANSKIGKFLTERIDSLRCSSLGFMPNNGHVLKLAVSVQNSEFLDSWLKAWNVSPNHIDRADNKTVLDYIDERQKRAGSTTGIGKAFGRYYRRFRAAGAKHRAEL